MNFLSKEYLPGSEGRISRLREIIDGRPVAILAAGPSIKELENRITELRDANICYFGFNNFSIQEEHILKQIGKNNSIVMCSAREHMAEYMKDIVDFLNRDQDNMFVSSFWRDTFELMGADFNLNRFLNEYDKRLIFFSLSPQRTVPNNQYPLHFIESNSLLVLIQLAIIGKASRIIIFGADGYSKDTGEKYYHNQSKFDEVRYRSVRYDTDKYFNPIAPVTIRNIYRTYDITPVEILNCSPDSVCTPFPKVSYDDAFDCLLGRKTFKGTMDLRVPKATVISLCLDTDDFLKETIENISRQSYTDYEHIVVCSGLDDKLQGMKKQFPWVRWISVGDMAWAQAFKKAVSMARGDYIIQCDMGEGYLNQDWINNCVEVLENDHDISLVYGASQTMLKDGALGRIIEGHFFQKNPEQGKFFIYDWLKRKLLFPRGNSCVRKKILEACFPFDEMSHDPNEAWRAFNYKFNISGYLPYFLSTVANYCREENAYQNNGSKTAANGYKEQLFKKAVVHQYKNGSSEILPGSFNYGVFKFLNAGRYIESKLHQPGLLLVKRVLNKIKRVLH